MTHASAYLRAAAPLLLLVAAAGCPSSSSTPPSEPVATPTCPASEEGRNRGVLWFIDCATVLSDLELYQTAVTARVRSDITVAKKDLKLANDRLREQLAAAAEQGKLDPEVMSKAVADIEGSAARVARVVTESLDSLHDALTPAQRRLVVRAYREGKVEQHTRVWQQRLMQERERIEEQLQLDQNQRNALEQALARERQRPKQGRGHDIGPFADDDFEASVLGVEERLPRRARRLANRRVELIARVLEVIRRDQTVLLAAYLDRAPDAE